ncbi:MAG TPA: hypothetical protein VF540_01215 [Segetibacter sp.]|jgi:hypothetical protein
MRKAWNKRLPSRLVIFLSMENSGILNVPIQPPAEWYSEEFIYISVVNFLKENGYKVQKEAGPKEDTYKGEKVITATKFFKKEVIEVKGFPNHYPATDTVTRTRNTPAKSWFTEALFNSFMNFNLIDNAGLGMALPNVSRYQAIVKELNNYFTINDLYFRIYLVNENGSVEVSNLNLRDGKASF